LPAFYCFSDGGHNLRFPSFLAFLLLSLQTSPIIFSTFFTFSRKFFRFQLFNKMKKVRRIVFCMAFFIGWSGLNP